MATNHFIFRFFVRAALAAFTLPVCDMTSAVETPKHVVSMNVCTDQMAMLIASPDQLYSVSHLASDPNSSVLVDQASKFVINHGLAEEIFLMQPDLVIAGTYTTRTTVDLLRRLGFKVEEFAPENSFEEVRANLKRMGEILGREQRAAELIVELDRGLAELAGNPVPQRTVAPYYANSHTSGAGTLVDAIVKASGLTNIGDRLGFSGTVKLPLELLLLANPDLIAAGDGRHDAPALAQENFVHPAYKAVARGGREIVVPPRYTICGAPFTLEAARTLQDAARNLPEGRQ
jgi:iron complex transport system substrate-binding protein